MQKLHGNPSRPWCAESTFFYTQLHLSSRVRDAPLARARPTTVGLGVHDLYRAHQLIHAHERRKAERP